LVYAIVPRVFGDFVRQFSCLFICTPVCAVIGAVVCTQYGTKYTNAKVGPSWRCGGGSVGGGKYTGEEANPE
jgi:hypothetical protein